MGLIAGTKEIKKTEIRLSSKSEKKRDAWKNIALNSWKTANLEKLIINLLSKRFFIGYCWRGEKGLRLHMYSYIHLLFLCFGVTSFYRILKKNLFKIKIKS